MCFIVIQFFRRVLFYPNSDPRIFYNIIAVSWNGSTRHGGKNRVL
jgi:hypothetical protein